MYKDVPQVASDALGEGLVGKSGKVGGGLPQRSHRKQKSIDFNSNRVTLKFGGLQDEGQGNDGGVSN